MKLFRLVVGLSIVLYVACVGLMAALKALGLIQGLSTPEMFYGPAITIVSCWIIFAIVYAISGRGKREQR